MSFSVCKYYVTGTCNRGDSCHHKHAVQRLSEAQVSARRSDGSAGAIRSLVQWKGKPDHVFTACDDGTVKMWATTDGSTWIEMTTVGLHEWRHVGALQEVEGILYVGYGMPFANGPSVTVDAVRVMDLNGSTAQDVVNMTSGYAHAQRINCVSVVKNAGGDLRIYTGDETGRIVVWARQASGGAFAQLAQLEGHVRAVTSLLSTASNGMLWSASEDSNIRIWNTSSNACEHTITWENDGHTAAVVALTLGQSAAEGTLKDYVISGSKDGTVGVFQATDGALTYKHKCGDGVSMLAVFDPTPGASALLLIGYEDGTIAIRNFPEFALAFELRPEATHVGHTTPVRALLPFNNPAVEDSYFLSAAEEGSMICWKVHKLTEAPPGPRS
ncbi:unnamed protein product [Ascophyllum nodosum]